MKNQFWYKYKIYEFLNMTRRVTIMVEAELDKKISAYQAKKCKNKMNRTVIQGQLMIF